MELQDALIPAFVHEFKVENDDHHVTGMDGRATRIAGRRRLKMVVELDARNTAEIDWLAKSLQENGNRISLIPAGSPIMHPAIAAPKVTPTERKTDQPKTLDSSW